MVELARRPAATRVAIASIAFLLFAGVVAVLTHEGGLGPGEARLHADGVANVISPNGEQRAVRGTMLVHVGDVVESTEGTMKIDLPDGSAVEGRSALKASPTAAQNTRVKIAHPVEVLAGDLLVTTNKSTDIDAGGNRVHLDDSDGQSAARVSRSLAVVAGVYRGEATLDSAGQRRTITSLRQLDVTTLGRPSAAPRPLTVVDSDAWDRRFLGEAMDLTVALDRYIRGYSPSLAPGEGRTVGFYRSLLEPLANQQDFETPMLDEKRMGNPGDTLVGAAIAGLGTHDTFKQRWTNGFAFHDAGAGWGLVALDQGVASDPLLRALDAALNGSPLQFVAAVRASAASGGGAAGTNGGATASGTASPSSSSAGTSPSGGTAGTSPGALPTPGTLGAPTAPTTPPPTAPTLPPILPPITPPPTTLPPSGGSGTSTGNPVVDGVVDDVNDLLNGGTNPPNLPNPPSLPN
jgi:hypothetical protein